LLSITHSARSDIAAASTLAERSGVSLSTVRRVEGSGENDSSRAASVRKIIDVLAQQEALGFHTQAAGVIDGVHEVGINIQENEDGSNAGK